MLFETSSTGTNGNASHLHRLFVHKCSKMFVHTIKTKEMRCHAIAAHRKHKRYTLVATVALYGRIHDKFVKGTTPRASIGEVSEWYTQKQVSQREGIPFIPSLGCQGTS